MASTTVFILTAFALQTVVSNKGLVRGVPFPLVYPEQTREHNKDGSQENTIMWKGWHSE
jgi:hypothetical protein